MKGYILLSRKTIDSEIWRKPPLYFKVWTYLLIKAQHKQYKNLKRGQLFTSVSEIQEACSHYVGYRKVAPTKKQIYGILAWLRNPCERDNEGECEQESSGAMIETAKGTQGTLINVLNYGIYQDSKNYEGNNEGDSGDGNEREATELRTGEQGNNINKNDKNVNNAKNDYIPPLTPPLGDDAENENDGENLGVETATGESDKTSPSTTRKPILSKTQQGMFEQFWGVYPKRQSRAQAERAWKKLNVSEELLESILRGVEGAKKYDTRFRDMQFVPLGSTWLNAEGWRDEWSGKVNTPQSSRYKPL